VRYRAQSWNLLALTRDHEKSGALAQALSNARTHEFFALGEASTRQCVMLCGTASSSASTSTNLPLRALRLASLEMDAPSGYTKLHESFARNLYDL